LTPVLDDGSGTAGREAAAPQASRSASPLANLRHRALYATRYFDCNPLKYRPGSCYNPIDVAWTYLANRARFRAVARPYGVIHIDPRSIRWNLRVPPRKWPLGLVLDGNWDTAFRRPVDIAWKISTMEQRFRLGLEWEETDLFRRFYEPRFAQQGGVKGARSLDELAARYRRVYDPLYEEMRRFGFLTPTIEHPDVSFVYVHIDRAGEFLYTLEGNHRLGMALALGLESIPVRVVTRHLDWQRVREAVKANPASPWSGRHADLHDLTGGIGNALGG
jgi:hypothetical protein